MWLKVKVWFGGGIYGVVGVGFVLDNKGVVVSYEVVKVLN